MEKRLRVRYLDPVFGCVEHIFLDALFEFQHEHIIVSQAVGTPHTKYFKFPLGVVVDLEWLGESKGPF